MSDPLSVAAGVVGVITAAAQISKLLIEFSAKTKDAPTQARRVLTEVNGMSMIMNQLQSFLLGLETPDQSRTCLIQAESLLSILTGCVATFSDLQKLLDQLKIENLQLLDRFKWARKESAIKALTIRLQTHKHSLSLILEILNGYVDWYDPKTESRLMFLRSTLQEVKANVHRLDTTMHDNYQEILERLRGLELQQNSSNRSETQESSRPSNRLAPSAEQRDDLDKTQTNHRSSKLFGFSFESDLAVTRVYRRAMSRSSSFTTEDPKTRWSMFSNLSVADIASRLSVLNLAITSSEVYNAVEYNDLYEQQQIIDESLDILNSVQFTKRFEHRAITDEQSDIIFRSAKRHRSANDNDGYPLFNSTYLMFRTHYVDWADFTPSALIYVISESLRIPLSIFDGCSFSIALVTRLGEEAFLHWRKLGVEEQPVQQFAKWHSQGLLPILLLSRLEQPFLRSGELLPVHNFGYLVKGWLLDPDLFGDYIDFTLKNWASRH